MLVESGEVRLQDPVSKFIPEFAAPAQVAVAKPGGAENAFDLVRPRGRSRCVIS